MAATLPLLFLCLKNRNMALNAAEGAWGKNGGKNLNGRKKF